eukprot:gnl/TRDRNA2_/TRDRNA2_177455_c0_seq11.p1 gnl/TRDRNA2_/TRDRNA2_177455_c0~~gnl/TRDRNA2_/TRDRNA2_177455_c0_seq11.p1  ORF type:complete len:708 (-),score=109.20 gnl/TRDRNA2_/TRDRNA2_177455_c0_seq11:158-2281(-)
MMSAGFDGGDIAAWLTERLHQERTVVAKQLEEQHKAIVAEVVQGLGAATLRSPPRNATRPRSPTRTPAKIDEYPTLLFESPSLPALHPLPDKEKSDVAHVQHLADTGHEKLEAAASADSSKPSDKTTQLEYQVAVAPPPSEQQQQQDEADDESSPLKAHAIEDAPKKPAYSNKRLQMLAGQEEDLGSSVVHRIVHSAKFEVASGCIILANVLVLAIEVQYHGLQTGYGISFQNFDAPADEVWPWLTQNVFATAEYMFCTFFLVELALRVIVLRGRALRCGWLWFDFIIVTCGILDWFSLFTASLNPTMMRVVRLARMIRVLKFVRMVKAFNSLFLLIRSIEASVSSLFWSFALLVTVQTAMGMMVHQILRGFLADESQDVEVRRQVFSYFGTFSRSMLTMFEITLVNWSVSCRLLINNVSEWFLLFYIIYCCMFCFALVRVITAVFVAETSRVALADDEMAMMKKQRMKEEVGEKLRDIFHELDDSGDGLVSWDEFQTLLSDSVMKTLLSTLDLDANDVATLFELLDDGDHKIAIDEFVNGVNRMKGQAKSIDVVTLLKQVSQLDTKLNVLLSTSQSTQTSLLALKAPLPRNPWASPALSREASIGSGSPVRTQKPLLMKCHTRSYLDADAIITPRGGGSGVAVYTPREEVRTAHLAAVADTDAIITPRGGARRGLFMLAHSVQAALFPAAPPLSRHPSIDSETGRI